jgi:AraC family transcriptional regulator, ethanolamine operon transcriptional activator
MHTIPDNADSTRLHSESAWSSVVRSTDIDEHAGAQPHWSLHYDQLSRGSFVGDLNHLQLPGLRLVHEAANCAVRQHGQIGEGHYGFAITLDQPGEAIFNGQKLDRESIMIGRSEELDLSTPAMFSMVGIVVDGELLGSLWERMYQKRLSAWLEQQIVVRVSPDMADALRTTHLGMLDRIRCTPELLQDPQAVLQMRDSILIEWIEAIPAQVDTSGLKTVAARKRVVQRACEMMLAQPDEPMSILQLCGLIGASPSKLEYCFRDILGISPAKYLRAVRLNGVRRDLKQGANAGRGVQDVAARWGFWHPSEFSADYKRQFAELPSETLRRARREQANGQLAADSLAHDARIVERCHAGA